MMCRAQTGAGRLTLRMQPSGAVTVIGASEPWLFGTSDAMAARTP